MDWLNKIIGGLRGRPQTLPGDGLAPQAEKALMMRKAYMQYVYQAQERGEQPLPPDQWVKQMQQMQQMQGGYEASY